MQVLLVLLVEVALAWFLHYRATVNREKLIDLILEKFNIDMNENDKEGKNYENISRDI